MFAQVGIGTTNPHASSMLELVSINSGLLVPRMTQAQKTAITTPSTGLLVYQTDGASGFWYFNGISWVTFTSTGWSLTGDSGTTPSANFLGTTDNQDFVISTNNTERIRFQTGGNVGIGTINPITKLHVSGTSPVLRIQDGNQALNKILISNATGAATWGANTLIPAGSDDDWRFSSGSTYASPIYRTGPTVIGRSGTTTHHLDIDNGANSGTTIGIGNTEYLEDGNNETMFSHALIPDLDNSYQLGINYAAPDIKRWNTVYAVNGTIQTSDQSLKTNIENLKYGIASVNKLKPVSYKWKEEKYLNHTIPTDKKEIKIGFIAQDLQKEVPEVVYDHSWRRKSEKELDTYIKTKNEYLGVNYEELIAVLVKAKQEQQLELEELNNETEDLLKKLELLINKK